MSERALAERLEAWRAGEPGECLPADAYAALAEGDLVGSWAADLEEHALECPLCAAERDLARDFLAEGVAGAAPVETAHLASIVRELERQVAEPLERPQTGGELGRVVVFRKSSTQPRPAWKAWSVPLAAAATLALGIGLFWQGRQLPGLPDPGSNGPIRSAAVELQSPLGDQILDAGQAAVPSRIDFRWLAVEGAARYRVRLLDATSQELWSGESVRTEIELPEAPRELLVDRVRYQWTVTALGAGGAVLAASEPADFRFLPAPESPGKDNP